MMMRKSGEEEEDWRRLTPSMTTRLTVAKRTLIWSLYLSSGEERETQIGLGLQRVWNR